MTHKRFWHTFVLYLHKMFFKNEESSHYMLIKETTTKTLILYIAVNNINKAGCARAQLNNLFAVSC